MNTPVGAKTISIVIVAWNCKKYVAECLDSLQQYIADPRIEVIVVDNASSDGTPDLVQNAYPAVTLIRNKENLGFAKGNNIGIRRSTGEYVCLVNSDVRIFEGCLEKMLAYMQKNADVGLLGPRMLGADGKPGRSYMSSLTLWRVLCRALALDILFPNSKLFSSYLMPYFKGDRIIEVDVLNGWFWMTRRKALEEVGLLEESFFMYGEDLDWSKRFHDAGWKLVFLASAESLHYGGASSARVPIRFSVEMQRANFQYWAKYYGRVSQYLYLTIIWLHEFIRLLGYCLVAMGRKSRRSEAVFKMKRSLACLGWVMGLSTTGEEIL